MLKTETTPTIKELIAEHCARIIESDNASKIRDELYLARKPYEAEEQEVEKAVSRMSDAEYAVVLCPVYTLDDLLLKADFIRKYLPMFISEPSLEEMKIEELAYVVPSRDLHEIMKPRCSPDFDRAFADAMAAYHGFCDAGEDNEAHGLLMDTTEAILMANTPARVEDIDVKVKFLRARYEDDPPEKFIEQIFSDIELLSSHRETETTPAVMAVQS